MLETTTISLDLDKKRYYIDIPAREVKEIDSR